MYGWRGRIGCIFPSRGDTFTYEFYRMAPDGLVLVATAMNVQELTSEHFERAQAGIEEAARLLLYEKCDVIMVMGTPVLSRPGPGYHRELVQHLQEMTGLPVTTDLLSAVRACQRLGAARIAVASPFRQDLRDREKESLEYYGLKVVHINGAELMKNIDITTQPIHATYRLAKRAFLDSPERPDAVFITCPRWATAVNIEPLEADLGVPIVTSSQASFWEAMEILKIREPVYGYGRLLEAVSHQPSAASEAES